jgi:hypothetical protein
MALYGARSEWRLAGDADDLPGGMISYDQPDAWF